MLPLDTLASGKGPEGVGNFNAQKIWSNEKAGTGQKAFCFSRELLFEKPFNGNRGIDHERRASGVSPRLCPAIRG